MILLTIGCGDKTPTSGKLTGESCSSNTECASGVCEAGKCAAWTLTKLDTDVFKVSCEFSSCHNSTTKAGGLDLQSGPFAALVGKPATNPKAASEGKNLVTAGDATNSFLNIKLTIPPTAGVCRAASMAELQSSYGGCMPQSSEPLEAASLDGVKGWIAAGAANN